MSNYDAICVVAQLETGGSPKTQIPRIVVRVPFSHPLYANAFCMHIKYFTNKLFSEVTTSLQHLAPFTLVYIPFHSVPDTMNSVIVHNSDLPVVTVNVIPAKIDYSGPANVDTHFTPSKTVDASSNEHKACFQGRELVGEEKSVDNYDAYVFHKSETLVRRDDANDYSDDVLDLQTTNTYTSIAKVDKFVVYGHDSLPSDANWHLVAEWIGTTEALNSQ